MTEQIPMAHWKDEVTRQRAYALNGPARCRLAQPSSDNPTELGQRIVSAIQDDRVIEGLINPQPDHSEVRVHGYSLHLKVAGFSHLKPDLQAKALDTLDTRVQEIFREASSQISDSE